MTTFPAGPYPPETDVYHKLLETAPDAMVVSNLDGAIVFVNGETERIFGHPRAELIGQPIEMLIPERLRAGHRLHRQRYASDPASRPMGIGMTLIATQKDGREFPVEVSLSPVQLDGARFVCAAVRDVSHLQGARDAVNRAHYNAHVAELGQKLIGARHLDDLSALIPDVTARALGGDAALLLLRDAHTGELVCRAAFGMPQSMMADVRMRIEPATDLHASLAAGDTLAIEDCAADKRFGPDPTIAQLGVKCALVAPIIGNAELTGVIIARFRVARAFSGDDRNFLRSVANIVSASMKYLHAEERLRHAQQLEAVGQLTGGIAHDFNNLLTVIMGNLQIVQEDVSGSETIAQPVDAALRAASSAAELTRKLLAFSRRQALRPRPIDVNALVGGMLEMIRRALGERITIIAYPDPNIVHALADPGQLETALLNLVVNARDAMPKGGRLSIETGVRMLDPSYADGVGELKPGRYVMVAVSDNGTGMPAEVLSRAFDPYFTTKARGKGSGLGLSLVHGFAKQSGGHAAIYSEPGRGTTVRIYLPLAKEQSPVATQEDPDRVPAGSETVLMVEDDEGVRRIGARFLTELGYRVLEASDSDKALEALAARADIELLFTDIVLPGRYDGVELAAEARRLRPNLALLFTSGYASGAIDGIQRLPAALLDKPYRREALGRAVRTALDRR